MAAKKTVKKASTKSKGSAPKQIAVPRQLIRNRSIRSSVSRDAIANMESVDPFGTKGAPQGAQVQVAFSSELGRRGSEVLGLGGGPKTTSIVNSTVARRRSRHAVLTNAYAKRGIDLWVSNVVGSGHRLVSEAPDPVLKKSVEDSFEMWSEQVDITGKLNLPAMMALAVRSQAEGGDAFLRMRTRKAPFSDGLIVPLQLQLFESEQVPVTLNRKEGNNNIIGGIEFSGAGMPLIYHMLVNHPGEMITLENLSQGLDTVPVRAIDILHLHDVKRPNEVRGLPILSQSLILLSDLDRYMDAELVRKKAAALIGGFITYNPGMEGMDPFITDAEGSGDAPGTQDIHIEALEPGTFPVLPFGYDVRFSEPADVGINFKTFMKQQLLLLSSALNLTYEQLSGDYTGANDRTVRAAMLEFKRIAIAYQQNVIVHQLCKPIFRRWFELAVLSGVLTIPSGMSLQDAMRVRWVADPWEMQNPLQEVQVEIKKVRAGFKSRSAVIIEGGDIPEDVDKEIRADKDREESEGLIFDTNAEVVSSAGVVQSLDPELIQNDETEATTSSAGAPVGNENANE